MNSNYRLIVIVIIGIGIGGFGTFVLNSPDIIEKIIIVDNNPELELRLQSEIESNQKMAETIEDIINACNDKLEDKYNNTNEKLKKENEILQKALSKLRGT